jgi:hypothetical protein
VPAAWALRVVLSISKLSTGQHRYYLDQAASGSTWSRASATGWRSTTSAAPRRVANGSAPAPASGVEGLVDGEALRRLLAGEDEVGEQLSASRAPVSVAGYDLTFSAPQSVSVLFTLGEADFRRGAGGTRVEPAAGILTTSVAALLRDLDHPNGGLARGAVLVVDEAGMGPTRQLATLLDAVERVDGKLVLMGDDREPPELEAGGGFRALVRRGRAIAFTENRRQSEAWARRALDLLRDGGCRACGRAVPSKRLKGLEPSTFCMARPKSASDWLSTVRLEWRKAAF